MFALVGFVQNPWVVDGDPNVPKVGGHSQLFYIAATGLNFGASDGSSRSRRPNIQYGSVTHKSLPAHLPAYASQHWSCSLQANTAKLQYLLCRGT
jgi:hypothetical protein